MKVTVYSRPGCHLCDEALAELQDIRNDIPAFTIETVDIDSDDDVFKRYLERIPVVEIEGEIVSDLTLDLDAVRRRLGNT